MARVKAGSRKMYVEEYGKGNARAIVFFHGGPGAGCGAFTDQARALGKKYHVVLFDQYGAMRSGAIPAKEPFGMMDHVRLIDDMRGALGIQSWAVLGHSYGGMLACLYARTYPERTDAVLYECSSWDLGLSAQSAAAFFLPRLRGDRSQEGIDSCERILNGDPAGRATLHNELRTVLAPLVRRLYMHKTCDSPKSKIKTPRSAAQKNAVHCKKIREEGLIYQSFRPYLDEIDRSSLLLAAKYDPVCGEPERDYFQRHAPNGTVFKFQDSGHFPHIEEPEAFTKTVTEFLDALPIR